MHVTEQFYKAVTWYCWIKANRIVFMYFSETNDSTRLLKSFESDMCLQL